MQQWYLLFFFTPDKKAKFLSNLPLRVGNAENFQYAVQDSFMLPPFNQSLEGSILDKTQQAQNVLELLKSIRNQYLNKY